MQIIYIDNIKEVLRNKKKLELELHVRISNKGRIIYIHGNAENEFLSLNILDAVNHGFSVDNSLKLINENNIINTLQIKDITKRHDLERIRGRIIGTNGKTLKTLKHLTNCDFAIKDNTISVIGDVEEIEDAIQAIKSIVYGSKHGKVYCRLERRRKQKKRQDIYHRFILYRKKK